MIAERKFYLSTIALSTTRALELLIKEKDNSFSEFSFQV
jgi:hypothetical protein